MDLRGVLAELSACERESIENFVRLRGLTCVYAQQVKKDGDYMIFYTRGTAGKRLRNVMHLVLLGRE